VFAALFTAVAPIRAQHLHHAPFGRRRPARTAPSGQCNGQCNGFGTRALFTT
jgi:hypothetical protein